MSSASARTFMPKIDGATEGQLGRPDVALGERKGPKPASLSDKSTRVEREMTQPERELMAALFDVAVKAWGGVDAVATCLGIDKSNVSRMCSGEKTVAFKHLLALLDDSADVILAVCQLLLARISYVARPANSPTKKQIASVVLARLCDGSIVGRSIINNAVKDSGWSDEQVSMALRDGDDDDAA